MNFNDNASNEWHTLVHVCRRWRNLAFTSPRHLDLQLLYMPHLRSVKEMLDIWAEIPIYIHHCDFPNFPSKEARDNVVAALRLNHRVSGIRLKAISDSDWEAFGPPMQRPFPALTRLWAGPAFLTKNAIPRSFLGGSAPSLRDLYLNHVPFPTLPELLLSATNLVRLRYDDIPPSGHISPQAMVTGLSALTRLETLSLKFRSPQSLSDRAIRIPPPHTRTLLPALTYLRFQGIPEYMEDIVAQIDAPFLESIKITFFHQQVLEISELAKFVRRADKLSLIDRAEVTYEIYHISVTLSEELLRGRVRPKTLIFNPEYMQWCLRFSYLAHFCTSCLPTLSAFESLHIHGPTGYTWQDPVDHPNPQWLEFLHPFNTVKDLRLSSYVAPHVAQALRGLPVERVMEVLPALENIFIPGLYRDRPVEAIYEFADARQLSGHPVSIHDREGRAKLTVGK